MSGKKLPRGMMNDEIASYVRSTATPETYYDEYGRPTYLLYNTEGGAFVDAVPAGWLPILHVGETPEDGEQFMSTRGKRGR